MKMLAETGRDDIAKVYLAETEPGKYVEFVQSLQPPHPRSEKWVLIVSTLYGCPVGCSICDAGGWFKGKISTEDIFAQIDHTVDHFYPNRHITAKQFKIQFARMGEPSLNANVLEVLRQLPQRYNAPGLMPSFSTIAPNGTDDFFKELKTIKDTLYNKGNFQMQFSIHSTDSKERDNLLPVKKWDFDKIAAYGKDFYAPGDRKITLNFALAEDSTLDPTVLASHFDPNTFLVKLTPVNPTISVIKKNIVNAITSNNQANDLEVVRQLRDLGFQVIVSIGELEENKIGSNCGQYVKTFMDGSHNLNHETHDAYKYEVKEKKR